MRRPVAVLTALGAIVLASATSAFVVLNSGGQQAPMESSAADVTKVTQLLQSCATGNNPVYGWEDCVMPKIPAAMEAYGPAPVIKAIYDYAASRSDEPGLGCHQLMHEVGRDTASYITEITSALKLGSLACQLGYQHGLIEQKIDDAPSMAATAKVCDPLINDRSLPTLIIGECYHAIGHGVIKRNAYNFRNALRDCETELTNPDIQLGCVSGVIMTWSNKIDSLAGRGEGMAPEDRLAPIEAQWEVCTLLTQQAAREGCANFTAEKVPPTVEGYKRFGTYCAEVIKVSVNCLAGVGRVVGGRSPLTAPTPGAVVPVGFHSIETIVARCAAVAGPLGGKSDTCLIAAASSRPNFDPTPGFVEKLCAAAPETECALLQKAWENSTRPRNA